MTEEVLYADMQALVANLRGVSDRLATGQGTLGKLLSEDAGLYDDLAATMASIRRISASVDAGEGTVGKLLKDAALYDEANRLFEDVRAAVDDLRESSPVTSFSSVMFGAF